MEEKQANHFYGGLNTDKHVEMRDDTCTLQNELFRVMDVQGHGLVDCNIMGNDYDDTVGQERGFTLPDGFVPMGEATFKGITFIISHNPTSNQLQFGSFPSPKYDGTDGFTNVYKPLFNYTDNDNSLDIQQQNPLDDVAYQAALLALRKDFTVTTGDPWNIVAGTMQIQARMNYDNSLNLYFADGNNPMRVINCGFNVFTGAFTKRAYCNNMFKHAIQVLNETDKPVRLYDDGTVREIEIGYTGQFKCGNVQFYFRYSDEDFNPTSFQSHSGMVSIIPSNEQSATNPHSFMGGPGDKRTNKSVKLFIDLLSGTDEFIDTNYKYLEIAYIRHYEQGAMEAFRISKRWEIWDLIAQANTLGQEYIEIEITDYEQKISATAAEIIKTKRKDSIALDLTTIEDRLWAGNLKVADYDFKTLYDFSKTIVVEPIKEMLDDSPAPEVGVTFAKVGYKNYQNVYHYAQYLAGETYCFGAQYLLKTTGKWSESFAVEGDDWYSGSASGTPNYMGILRFPSMSSSAVIVDTDSFNINGVQFVVPATAPISNLVTAIRFTRVERKKNLLYQGVICKAFCSNSDPYWGRYANAQDFPVPNLWQHYPYAYSLLDISTSRDKAVDGKAFAYFSNTRSWPSPFSFNDDISALNQDAGVGAKFTANGYVTVANWLDPYTNPANALLWTRCDIPWKLFMNSKEIPDTGSFTSDSRISFLHWYRAHIGVTAVATTTPGYDKSGTNYLEFDAAPYWAGKMFAGTSYKGDRTGWHKGPAHIIPGWNKGLWGIYSLDFAIKKDLKETSYFIKKIGEADSSFTNSKGPNANKIYSYDIAPNTGVDGKDMAAINDLLKDFENWLTDPAGFKIPFTGLLASQTVFSGELSNIGQWQLMPNKQFVSYFAEGNGDSYNGNGANPGKDNNDDDTVNEINNKIYADKQNADFHFYFFSQKNKKNGENGGQLDISNLEFGGAPYIGVDFTGVDYTLRPNFWQNELVAIYVKNPDDANFDITEWYNPANEQFFPITEHFYLIPGEADPAASFNAQAFRGDSFPAHAYLKTMTNPKYNPNSRDDSYAGYINQGTALCSYGQILGYAAEHTCNTGLRHAEDAHLAKHVDELDFETFYPGLDPQTPYNYAHLNRGRESFRYNDGYSKQLSVAVSPGFDIQIPFREQHFQCRVMYSAKQTDEAIQDSWRDIAEVNYKDFEGKSGALTRIVGAGGKLYSFYYSGVRMHPVNELVQAVTNAGTVVLGQQNEILPDKSGALSDAYGCQQTKALGESDYFIYWFDYNKRVICQIAKGDGQVKVISVTEQINTLIYNDIEPNQQFSDIRYDMANMPGYYEGATVGYNRKYKEFYISYQKANDAIDGVLYKRTIIYSELLSKFTGTIDMFVPMFITINEDFYHFDFNAMEQTGNGAQKRFWLADQEKDNAGLYNYQTFFGQLYPSWFEVVVNKNSSFPKAFDQTSIQMNDVEPMLVELNTAYQQAIMDPFNVAGVTPRYIMPKYRENKWEFSIKRADTVTSQYRVGSNMRGNHMRILVRFETNLPIFAKSLITKFRYSLH